MSDELLTIEDGKTVIIKPEGMSDEEAKIQTDIMNEYAKKFYQKLDADLQKYGEVEIKFIDISSTVQEK